MTTDGQRIFATRRLILQGAGAVALVGLGNIPFGLAPAFAAANDKYPEEAFKAEERSRRDQVALRQDRRGLRQGQARRARDRRERRGGSGLGHAPTLADVTSIAFLVSENPIALVASYKIPAGTVPSVANRIKMAKTSNVIVVVGSRRQALQRHQGSQSHRRRLRRLTRMIRRKVGTGFPTRSCAK